MRAYPVKEIVAAMNGTLLQEKGEHLITGGVSTDTRSIPENALFFALRGENFDAHNFLAEAVSAGAGALVVDQPEKVPANVPAILVDDVLNGLQRLAHWYRQQLGIPVVAITGSNGKTSTKDLITSVLSQKFKVNATKGNLNNHIGLPLSVLATSEDDEVGVFEMGMNHPGEIAPLCEIARPDVSIITNIGSAHIENMGSRDAIAEEKGAVARALTEKGTLLISANCEYADYFTARNAGYTIAVGNGRGAVRAENLLTTEQGTRFDLVIDQLGRIETSIEVSGKHMVSNAMLAAGAGHVLGLSLEEIAQGLAQAELTSGRLRRFDHEGVGVIDDTYNANKESVSAAIETLAELPAKGSRVIVLGMLAELGEHTSEAYQSVGRLAAKRGLTLVVVGGPAKEIAESASAEGSADVEFFEEITPAAAWLKSKVQEGDLVLFKGSRAAAMERVMNQAFPEK